MRDMDLVIKEVDRISSSIDSFSTDTRNAVREHSNRILALEQGSTGEPRANSSVKSNIVARKISGSPEVKSFSEGKIKTAGVMVASSSMLPSIQNNTIVTSPATSPEQQLPGIIVAPEQKSWLRQLIPNFTVSANNFVYTRELAFTNNAEAQAADGAEKAETDITFEEVTGWVSTYAHWLKMSRQVVTDNPQMLGFTEQRLRYGLELKIESALILGDGTTGRISGLLDAGNFTAFTPEAGDTAVDSLRKAKLSLESANYQAGLYIVNPADLSAMELLKDAQDRYIVGRPVQGGLATLWGVPVYATTAMTAGSFIALDSMQAVSLHLRENTIVQLSDSDDDNFTKNLITMRVEARLGFAVHLPAGVCSGGLTL